MKRDGATKSIWQETIDDYQPKNIQQAGSRYDVLIVGGGITGFTTAYELQKKGKQCILIEANTPGFGTTSGTTAHLNTLLDLTYKEFEKKFGEDKTKLILQCTLEAIDLVRKNQEHLKIDCEFKDQQGFQFSLNDDQTKLLDENFEAAKKAGCSVNYIDSIPIPIPFQKALKFGDQAQIHPAKYILGLAKAFEETGGVIVTHCRLTSVKEKEDKTLDVETSTQRFTCTNLIYATHVPPGVNILHFRCAPYRSYVMAATLKNDQYPDALLYDMDDPYHYYRTQEIDGQKYLIAGGEDHKTGEEENTSSRHNNLEKYLRKYFAIDEIKFKWSSQYFQSTDGLPYIGHLPGNPDSVYVATGYGGNGITFSQAAAITLADLIITGESAYKDLFNPSRVSPVAGFNNFVKEAADVVSKLVGKFFNAEKIKGLSEINNNEAKVIRHEGASIALYRDHNGTLHSVNSACTHIKCSVAWNDTELVWECPCHGSRFGMDGEVYTAPAVQDLETIELKSSRND